MLPALFANQSYSFKVHWSDIGMVDSFEILVDVDAVMNRFDPCFIKEGMRICDQTQWNGDPIIPTLLVNLK